MSAPGIIRVRFIPHQNRCSEALKSPYIRIVMWIMLRRRAARALSFSGDFHPQNSFYAITGENQEKFTGISETAENSSEHSIVIHGEQEGSHHPVAV